METLHDYLFKHMEEFIDYNDEFYFLETTTPETRMKTLMSMEPIDVFLFSASIGDLDYCKHLVTHYGVKINDKDCYETDITMVIDDEAFNVFQWAMESGLFWEKDFYCYFVNLIGSGDLKCAKWLAEKYGIDIHAENDKALRFCFYPNTKKCIEWLIENGADIHAEDDYLYKYVKTYAVDTTNDAFREHFKWISSFGGH